jgi:hypothetical protein
MLFCPKANVSAEYSYMEIIIIIREAGLKRAVWQVRKGWGIQESNDDFSFTKIDSRRCPCIPFALLQFHFHGTRCCDGS